MAIARVDHPGLDKFENLKGFYPRKNPETILKAFILCRDDIPHHLVFAGRRARDYMLHLGFKDKDPTRVHFITFIPYEELPMLYNTATMSIVSAYYDGCSTTMMEAMSCGCPSITSKTGACPEIGGETYFMLIPRTPWISRRK